MHALIFWGFLILLARAGQFFFIGFFPEWRFASGSWEGVWSLYFFVKDLAVVLVSAAVLYALYRRLIVKPDRLTLSGEGIVILLLILVIMVTDVLFDAAYLALKPEQEMEGAVLGAFVAQWILTGRDTALLTGLHNLGYWGHVISILVFLTLIPRSKHFHILLSFPNVYFSRIKPGSRLTRLDFEDEHQESFGVTQIEQLSWKSLLDLHTCTECGRCDVVCPAWNSGKPLSPKQLTVDLRNHLNASTPGLINPANFSEQKGGRPAMVGGVIQDETLWSCTTCGACEEACPVMIEYVNKIVDLRRGLVMTDSRFPPELTNAFKSLETNSNPWGFGRDSRADWAKDLEVKIWDKDHPSDYLYFVGCNGSFDSRGKKITLAVVRALKEAGVDFSILGNEEGCTGDPARRSGNEFLFDMLASANAETFKQKGILKVITHCPHCFNTLKNEYPEFGANLEVIHHSQFLNQLEQSGRMKSTTKTGERVVVHDSCYLGRHNEIYDAPREVIDRRVEQGNRQEVETSREQGTCCGAGGARFLMEEKTGTRMSHNRIDELMQAKPDTIAVSCPFCVLMLEDGLKGKGLADQVKVVDIAELGNRGDG